MADEGVDERAVRVSGRRVDNQARRLVDDDQMRILVADIENATGRQYAAPMRHQR